LCISQIANLEVLAVPFCFAEMPDIALDAFRHAYQWHPLFGDIHWVQ
jgi:hypothetical protein